MEEKAETGSMVEKVEDSSMVENTEEVVLDQTQVKKAVQALQAFLKTKAPDSLLLQDSQKITLLFTLWKIPKRDQKLRIPLPHGQHTDTDEVCLFTRDEPSMSGEQTKRFYQRLLTERGVKGVTEVIPLNTLKTEYKSYESKRRLLGNFDRFLSDDRIHRLLPSNLGKHFYERKKNPLPVDLTSKQVARNVQRIIQGTNMSISTKGSCCMARIAHAGMTTEEMVENIMFAFDSVVKNIFLGGKVIKVVHLKSESSVALPIYTSDPAHLTQLEEVQRQAREARLAKQKGGMKRKQEHVSTGNMEQLPKTFSMQTPKKKKAKQTPVGEDGQKTPKRVRVKKDAKAKDKLTKSPGKRPQKHIAKKFKKKVPK